MPAIPAAIETLTGTVQVTVVARTASIQVMIDAVAASIQSVLNAIAFAIQVRGTALVPHRSGPVGAPIQSPVDTLAAMVEAVVDAVAAPIEALLNTVTAPIEAVFDAVAEIRIDIRPGQQNCQQGCAQHAIGGTVGLVHGCLPTFNQRSR